MGFHTGRLLIATPQLRDPNFTRSVVLVLDHDEEGALGVVINRPLELPLADVLPTWSGAVASPELLFSGGPVARESALAVGLSYGAGPADGFKRLVGEIGLVDLDAEPENLVPSLVGLRVFAGYAGWSDAQLEAEIEEGSWYVVSPVSTDLLHPEPDKLWRSILRRQPGELAFVATFPDDVTMN